MIPQYINKCSLKAVEDLQLLMLTSMSFSRCWKVFSYHIFFILQDSKWIKVPKRKSATEIKKQCRISFSDEISKIKQPSGLANTKLSISSQPFFLFQSNSDWYKEKLPSTAKFINLIKLRVEMETEQPGKRAENSLFNWQSPYLVDYNSREMCQ